MGFPSLCEIVNSISESVAAYTGEFLLISSRYYDPGKTLNHNHEPLQPRSSHDVTLTALAQLGALRLNVKRCMISLFDRSTQYVIAEATQTLSLQNDSVHEAGDGLWMGVGEIPKDDGCRCCDIWDERRC